MGPFIRLVSTILAVYFSERRDVLILPPAEKHKVVESLWVLIQTHESEKSVDDLIIDLKPGISL